MSEEVKGTMANGVDSGDELLHAANGHGKKFAAFVPHNVWEFVWGITKLFGFPALMCLAMAYYVWHMGNVSRAGAEQAHRDFRAAMQEQTAAVREGTAEQRKMTEAMIRLDSKIDAHLRTDDRHR